MEYNLFENICADASGLDPMAEGAVLLRGKVLALEYDLLPALRTITEQAVTAHVHSGRVHDVGRYDQLRSRELD
jgi:hypothetical protein